MIHASSFRPRLLFGMILLLSSQLPLLAYNDPVDRAGPLVVRIEGPSEVSQIAQAVPVAVVLQNQSDHAISGALHVSVIDQWQVEPVEPVGFEVPAGETVRHLFHATAGEGTYSAHYPIHAIARFTDAGRDYTAHPVLILKTSLPGPSRTPVVPAWKPLRMTPDSSLALWQMAVRRTMVQVFGEPPYQMPVGAIGTEPRSRADVAIGEETLDGQSRAVIVMHPPWFEGHVGTVVIEYPVALPDTRPIQLTFANAMNPGGQSDGVTFRVRVAPWDAPDQSLGTSVFERHVNAKTWQPATVDLSAYAGQEVRIQLESHPGPKNNTGWDRSFWAEPTLVAGTPPSPAPFPPPDRRGSELLGQTNCGTTSCAVRLWPGSRGLLDATLGIDNGSQEIFLNGFQVTVLGSRVDLATSPIRLRQAVREPADGGVTVRHCFESDLGSFDLSISIRIENDVLRTQFTLDNLPPARPWFDLHLEDVAIGRWSHPLYQVYAGTGNVVRRPGAYQLSFDGHRLATSFVGYDFQGAFSVVEATDTPPRYLAVQPDRDHASLHASDPQVRTLIPSANVWEAAKQWRKVNTLKAAAGVPAAAGRFVFDLWGGKYADSGEALRNAFRYGLTDAMVVWHNWQRWGYDYRLPEIYPPNPQFGTQDELREMIASCRDAGVLFALHDNYIDYYPDADGFSYQTKIAFRPDGTPVPAWLNEGRGAQSYRYRSDCVPPILKRNLALIRDGLEPSAYFIDVWSSVRPYDYWTADGDYYSAVYSRNMWGELFAWIRDYLGNDAPQISESGHDQLIGWLDGAQTNHLRVGTALPGRYSWSVWDWKCDDAERIPWFDVAHHDRFVLHGAGYESRYVAGLDRRMHGIYSDDYLATEVLTGHPAMVSRPFDRDVVRKYWLTHDLMRALALRTIESVEFVEGDLHRQHVRWSGGADVWVNRGETDWRTGDTTLPPFGFLARVPVDGGYVVASIERRDQVIVESSVAPNQLYVNARSQVGDALPIRLAVRDLKLLQGRQFQLQLEWRVGVPIPDGWTPFLHFCDAQGEIKFQASLQPARFASGQTGVLSATATGTIPEGCQSGQSYELCFGLYHPESGRRLALTGPDMGDRRIRLGSMRLEATAGNVEKVDWVPFTPAADPYLQRFNTDKRRIDFEVLTTTGGCRLTRSGDDVLLTPLPDGRETFDVAIDWSKLPWKLVRPAQVESVGSDGSVVEQRPVGSDAGRVVVTCRPGVFAYRLLCR